MTDMEILHQYDPTKNPILFKRNLAYLFINRRNIKDVIQPYLEFQQKYDFRVGIVDLCIRLLYTKTQTGFQICDQPEKIIQKTIRE